MIFVLWFTGWAIVAHSALAFVLPSAGLVVRAAYTNRSLTLIRWYTTVAASLMFIFNLFIPENTIQYCTILSLRVLIFSALMIHILEGAPNVTIERLPKIGFAFHYVLRVMNIVKVRQSDLWYAFKISWQRTSWDNKHGLILGAFVNSMLEFIILIKQIWMIVYARGGVPDNLLWKQRAIKKYFLGILPYSLIGDFFLFMVLVTSAFANKNDFLPNSFHDAAQWLISFFHM